MIEVQTAVFDKLLADATLVGALASYEYENGATQPCIFDHLPQTDSNAIFPCVQIDYPQMSQLDTDTTIGFEAEMQLHVWSVERGNKQASNIQTMVYNILHRSELVIDNFKFSGMHQTFSEILRDPDGITRHGIQQFKIFFEQG